MLTLRFAFKLLLCLKAHDAYDFDEFAACLKRAYCDCKVNSRETAVYDVCSGVATAVCVFTLTILFCVLFTDRL